MKILLSFLFVFTLALTARSQTITTYFYEIQERIDTTPVIETITFTKTDSAITQMGTNPKVFKIIGQRKTPEGHVIYRCKSGGNFYTIWFMQKLQAVRVKIDSDPIGSILYFQGGKRPKE